MYSVSADMTLKMWSLRERAFMDTFYGHTGTILNIQYLTNDRLITTANDTHVIVWKVSIN